MSIQQKADAVLSSQAVFTGLTNEPEALSIAIIDNKITAIGSREEMNAWIGLHTKVYDFGNQLIMAGFHDFHLHVMWGSLSLDGAQLHKARSEEEAVELVRAYAASRPNDPWIMGFGWNSGHWVNQKLPHRSSLDRILPDRPAVLFHSEGHYVWVNSKALEVMNVNHDTEAPPFGIISKDENGEPDGILYETAIALVSDGAYELGKEQKARSFQNFLGHAAKLGVTSINDMYSIKKLESFELFQEFAEEDKLTMRMHLLPELNGDIERVKRLRARYQSDMVRVVALKQFIDGVISGYTAYMIEPYTDQPDTCGETTFSPEVIKKWVAEADRDGFSIRFHCIGDAAIRLALDSFKEAQSINGKRDSRHSIEHVEVIHPDDIHRFQQLGVIASMQPEHLYATPRHAYEANIGEERSQYAWAVKSLKEAGATIAFGSDFPIVGLNPMAGIYRAVTRIDHSDQAVWNPDERITLAEALQLYTATPAYGVFREHELGTLETGKLADIVVLDRNLFAVPAEEILETKVVLTMVNGRVVFRMSET
ncbi:MAG: amidohydrolase [Brevibacillus sp.]|nr:amidohydrolase [Brevibacillus sp.]